MTTQDEVNEEVAALLPEVAAGVSKMADAWRKVSQAMDGGENVTARDIEQVNILGWDCSYFDFHVDGDYGIRRLLFQWDEVKPFREEELKTMMLVTNILNFDERDVALALMAYTEGELCAGATFLRKDTVGIDEEERAALLKSHGHLLAIAQSVHTMPATKPPVVSMKWASTSKKNRKVGPN